MPARRQVNRRRGVALPGRQRRDPRAVEHELGGRRLASVDVKSGPSGGVSAPLAVPAHRKRQAFAIRFCRLGNDEPADVVEEREREIEAARRKIEPAVDARDDARPVLGADFDRSSRFGIGEISRAKSAFRDEHAERRHDDGERRGEASAANRSAARGEPEDGDQGHRVERAKRDAVEQAADVRRRDEIQNPEGGANGGRHGRRRCHATTDAARASTRIAIPAHSPGGTKENANRPV